MSLSARSIMTQMATAGVIGAVGDGIMQRIEHGSVFQLQDYDTTRCMNIMCYRIPQAPVLAYIWTKFDLAAVRLNLSGWRGTIFKIACDQLFLNPAFTSAFLLSQSCFEGRSMSEAASRTAKGFWPLATGAFQYFSVVHCVTFGVCPVPWRIAWLSCAGVGWTAYMSHTNHLLKEQEEAHNNSERDGR